MPEATTLLNFGVELQRWGVQSVDEVQPPAFWQQPLDQMYARMPFRMLWDLLTLIITHMDHPNLDQMRAAKQPCLEDYAPNVAGYQMAIGLTMGLLIAMGIYPAGHTPDYTGPYRPLTLAACQATRKALAHEIGHFYFYVCRIFGPDDDVSRLCRVLWDLLRPHQAAGDSSVEDAAETYRALRGCNETIGTFSDGKPFSASPELGSLVACLYWLCTALKGVAVHDVVPKAGGVMYQALIGGNWRWRWISAVDWHSEEYNGSTWVRI